MLSRSEKIVISLVCIALAVIVAGSTILRSRGYSLSAYVRIWDVAAIGSAVALLFANLAAMGRNVRVVLLFLTVIGALTIIGTVHMYHLAYGGFPCR